MENDQPIRSASCSAGRSSSSGALCHHIAQFRRLARDNSTRWTAPPVLPRGTIASFLSTRFMPSPQARDSAEEQYLTQESGPTGEAEDGVEPEQSVPLHICSEGDFVGRSEVTGIPALTRMGASCCSGVRGHSRRRPSGARTPQPSLSRCRQMKLKYVILHVVL